MQDVLQNKATLPGALQVCLDKKLHFAAYRLPGKSEVTVIIQRDQEISELKNLVSDFPQKGFLITPFSRETGDKTFLIRPDYILRNSISDKQLNEIMCLPDLPAHVIETNQAEETQKEQYLDQIENIIERISSAEFEKVVLSRVKTVKGNYSSRLTGIFNALCETYNHAFVYLFCVNGNCWTGATPEPFVCSKAGTLVTVSLAGTRPYDAKNMDIGNWNRKELLEQEYVTRHIEKVLLEFSVRDYQKSGPYTSRAGNLSHLRTDFTFSVQSAGSRLPSLINALHPTPAVCGMASGTAMDFIRSAEKHSREYYTGFLGPVGIDDLLQLFVNLRCMKVLDDRLVLFIGGGITRDSVPEEEWEETEIKADTLLSVLHQIK
jgi:isochorismate synthase